MNDNRRQCHNVVYDEFAHKLGLCLMEPPTELRPSSIVNNSLQG